MRKRRRFDATVLLSPAARKVKVPGRRSSAFSSSLFPLFSVRLLLLQNTFTRCACYFFLFFSWRRSARFGLAAVRLVTTEATGGSLPSSFALDIS